MEQHSADHKSGPFRADIVGSLLRPQRLHEARADRDQGRLTDRELRAIESEEVRGAVALQREVGLKCCTDGEFHRRHWFIDFIERIHGIKFSGTLKNRFRNESGEVEFSPPRMVLHARVEHRQDLAVADFSDLKPTASAAGMVAKQAIPSPTLVHFRSTRAGLDRKIYPDPDQFYDDIARVYRAEIDRLYAAGCRYLQLDETNLPAHFSDPALRHRIVEAGEDPDVLVGRYVKLINDSISTTPTDMTLCMHMCRGNHAGAWGAEGGYDPVAEISFSQINVDAFFLEYDTPRAGSFTPLRYLAKNKMAVLGLVTTKNPALERKDDLKRRIDEASSLVPLERLALSPQCGFASTIEGNPLTIDDEKRKLSLVVETASEVWGGAG